MCYEYLNPDQFKPVCCVQTGLLTPNVPKLEFKHLAPPLDRNI